MDTRKNIAAEKKRLNTHNCAQAVTSTYCDVVGLDEQTALTSPEHTVPAWATWKARAGLLSAPG